MSVKINFVLLEMTWIRYFMPLIIEANKRGVRSRVFVGRSDKYNCPHKYKDTIYDLATQYNFDIIDVSKAKEYDGIFFLVEAKGRQFLRGDQKKIVLTYMTNYWMQSWEYCDEVDHIIYPSKYLADFYNIDHGEKDLYLGCPKYDIELSEEEIIKKYNLPDKKRVMVLAPRRRDLNRINLDQLYKIFRKHGYDVVVKTRGKDPLPDVFMGDQYFEDDSWFPHTSMELMKVCDVIINFSSTAIKESLLLRKPMINFQIKPHPLDNNFGFLFRYDYCENFDKEIDEDKIVAALGRLTTQDLEDSYDLSIKNHLFTGNSSKRILDHFLGEA
jgi:hypothetical protein